MRQVDINAAYSLHTEHFLLLIENYECDRLCCVSK